MTWPPTIYGNNPPQCTDGAAIWTHWCTRYGILGNAKDWPANWVKHGGLVTNVPEVGADACFQPGVDGADLKYGHVGVVRQISGHNFLLEEMNGPGGPGHMDTRWCATVPGVSFLLEGAPAPAPAPVPAPPQPSGIIWVAFPGVVDVDTANVRGNPWQSSELLREVHRGAELGFDGYDYGNAVWDPTFTHWDHKWFHIDAEHGYGWIASALVNGDPPHSHL